MTKPKMGELFAGYGGLGLGVSAVLDTELAWVSEYDKGPSKILAHRFPDVPNHGDITKINWSQVEPVDILTGGSPCQDLSHAGRRAGMTEGTRSNLWVAMREAIAQLKPSLVVWENVGGAFSAAADSEVEPCAGCVGDGSGVHLRALGRVVGDLASLGYVGRLGAIRAADVGAPHGRLRVFLAAHPAGQRWPGCLLPRQDVEQDRPQPAHGGAPGRTGLTLLPTPTTQDAANTGGASQFDRNSVPLNALVTLLPTPAVNDMGASYTPDEWDAWTERMKAEHGNGNGHGKSLHIEAARLTPAPSVNKASWGEYADAIQQWEMLTRPAPAPTETSPKGKPWLSPTFVEWMQGLPAGWVTDVPGVTRNEALKAFGNGVVPQQAAAALRSLLLANQVAA